MNKIKKQKKILVNDEDIDDDTMFPLDFVSKKQHNVIKNDTYINTKIVIPWIEKYRPKTVRDIMLDTGTQKKILNMVDNLEIPNIIITGSPGIGKTTTTQCISKSFYGKYVKDYVLELNASDERGIKIVQEIITDFCKKKFVVDDASDKKYPDHKMIILDEADNMTPKAQRLINTLMETYHKTTRFAFTCNNSHDIIEAIQSKCIIFKYHKLSKKNIMDNLKNICEKEKLVYEDKAIEEVAVYSHGDMRTAINNLQLICNGCERKIMIEGVRKMCDRPQPHIIFDILKYCVEGDVYNAMKMANDLKISGYSGSDIMLAMFNTIKLMENTEFSEDTKLKLLDHVSKTAYIISKGIDTNLQITGCIAGMANDTYV